jgi:hypothetical protein
MKLIENNFRLWVGISVPSSFSRLTEMGDYYIGNDFINSNYFGASPNRVGKKTSNFLKIPVQQGR